MSADPATLAAARHVLNQLGVTLADLQTADPAARLPTIAEYLPRVTAAAGPGAQRTYGTYWDRMATTWPDRPLDSIAASDIEALKQQMIHTARTRLNSRNGRHAGEHLIAAARAFYTRAIADNLIPPATSPAHRIANPADYPAPAAPSPNTNWNRSTPPPAGPATTSPSTHSSYVYTPKPPADAAARSPYA